MFVVHVFVQVRPGKEEAFIKATLENAKQSVKEPGIARFDVVQELENPTRFILVEVYRTRMDPQKHKETAHYQTWRETVHEMMAIPRSSIKLGNVFPDEDGWDSQA